MTTNCVHTHISTFIRACAHCFHSGFTLCHSLFVSPIQDIADTFEGNFKEQSGLNSNWLPVNSAQVRICCVCVCARSNMCNHCIAHAFLVRGETICGPLSVMHTHAHRWPPAVNTIRRISQLFVCSTHDASRVWVRVCVRYVCQVLRVRLCIPAHSTVAVW